MDIEEIRRCLELAGCKISEAEDYAEFLVHEIASAVHNICDGIEVDNYTLVLKGIRELMYVQMVLDDIKEKLVYAKSMVLEDIMKELKEGKLRVKTDGRVEWGTGNTFEKERRVVKKGKITTEPT